MGRSGGGGGAGAFVQKIDYPITGVPSSSVNWAVAIGGAGSPYQSDGNPSTFTVDGSTFTASGGGRGQQSTGNPGGSGGGGGRTPSSSPGGSSTVPQTIDGNGNTPPTGIGYAGGTGSVSYTHLTLPTILLV